MAETKTLRLAVCLFPNVTSLDFIGPVEIMSFLDPARVERSGTAFPIKQLPYHITTEYLNHTVDPVTPMAKGPELVTQRTYAYFNDSQNREQFDILLIPGGNIISSNSRRPN